MREDGTLDFSRCIEKTRNRPVNYQPFTHNSRIIWGPTRVPLSHRVLGGGPSKVQFA